MASQQLSGQLVKHIDEALAMEQNVLRMLDDMIETTADEEIKSDLRQHKLETEQHVDRLQQRLAAHDASPSTAREAAGIAGALMKGVVDMVRQEKAGRNARDGYATEHLEIAAYQLLERVAEKAGDTAEKVKDFAEEAIHDTKVAADFARLTTDTPDGLDQAPADDYSAGRTKEQRSKDTR
jgi:ferritin-like metal-binding protein YciE